MNARSPPTTSVLESKMQGISVSETKTQSAQAQAQAQPAPRVIYPRTPRDGYGFRPQSGTCTPTLREPEDEKHEEEKEEVAEAAEVEVDGEADKKFNDEVRAALTQPAASTSMALTESVADAEGLGWPGGYSAVDES